ncbi:zinc finger protein 45-like isoform X2 [Dreissena polymorpha]|nr:zinc finger protein 45-like isoform X2 [Dreissena polymorpha]
MSILFNQNLRFCNYNPIEATDAKLNIYFTNCPVIRIYYRLTVSFTKGMEVDGVEGVSVLGEVNMQQLRLVTGHIYGNTIQTSDGSSIISIDPSHTAYSTPIAMEQVIIDASSLSHNHVIITRNSGIQSTDDDSDTDVNDKIAAGMYSYHEIKTEELSEDLVPDRLDRLSQSISHHDYISSSVPILSRARPLELGVSKNNYVPVENGIHTEGASDGGLVIEEAVEQEVLTTSTSLEDEEIVRSKPLTAMYLQSKIPVSDSLYGSVDRDRLISTPTKSPGSSRFTLKPSSRTIGMEYDDLRLYPVDDLYRMKHGYGDQVSVYHPNTGEITFRSVETDYELDKKSPSAKRSVEAILAASETIKNQDIASEIEIGTCEVEVSPSGRRGRKPKYRTDGIEEDIEQIKKASKDVGYTLKGKGLKQRKDGKKRKKPRIRLTLTKAKHRQLASRVYLDDAEDDDDDDNKEEYEPISVTKSKRGRKRKDAVESTNIIYQCEYCEKQFKTRDKVRAHTKIHTEERAFGCDICGSSYRRREHLIRHYRRHTNDRPYECMECGKSYMRAEHLKRHSYDHTGEKPFECPICPKKFTRHDRLIKHSLVHDK